MSAGGAIAGGGGGLHRKDKGGGKEEEGHLGVSRVEEESERGDCGGGHRAGVWRVSIGERV